MKKILLTLGAIVAGTFTLTAGIGHAARAQALAPRTVAIHYGDLDLGSAAGRASLDHRIRHAVRAACGEASPADLRGQNQAATCRDDLIAGLAEQREAALASAARRGSPAILVARR